MRNYLLLLLSIVFLLFAMPKNSSLRSFAQQLALKKACSHTTPGFKKPCARKCFKHRSHSEPEGAATTISECGQQVYAVAPASEQHSFYQPYFTRSTVVSDSSQLLSPYLETDHAPPRHS